MKRIQILALLLIVLTTGRAQSRPGTFTFMPQAGVSVATTSIESAKYKMGFVGGINLDYQATDLFSITIGVLRSMEGYKYPEGDKLYMDYWDVPLLANFYVYRSLAVKAGGQFGFLSGARHKVGDKSEGVKEYFNTVNFSIPVGVSYEYSNFMLEARYNIGLSNLLKDKYSDGGKDAGKSRVFMITLGYKFAIN